MILAIDPGKHALAWAKGTKEGLEKCGYTKFEPFYDWKTSVVSGVKDFTSFLESRVIYCIEQPIIRENSNVRKQDILDLYFVFATCYNQFYPLTNFDISTPTPIDWKGTVPKEIHNKRIIKNLLPQELDILARTGHQKNHNVIDAIGLLKWYIKQ